MEKVKVTLVESCILESTLIVEGNFPEDEQERWDAISELAHEGFEKGKGTEPTVNCICADIHWD
jgi:hypothetical protein